MLLQQQHQVARVVCLGVRKPLYQMSLFSTLFKEPTMLKATLISAALGLALASPTWAQAANLTTSPPGEGYEQVSKLVKLPDFIPGMGQLFVKPATLPAGP